MPDRGRFVTDVSRSMVRPTHLISRLEGGVLNAYAMVLYFLSAQLGATTAHLLYLNFLYVSLAMFLIVKMLLPD